MHQRISEGRENGQAEDDPFASAWWENSVLSAGRFLHVAGRLRTSPEAEQGRIGLSRLAPQWSSACARECAINLMGTVGGALGSLDPVERLVKLKLTLPEFLGEERHALIGEGASDLLIELLGQTRGPHRRTLMAVAALPAGVVMEATAIIRLSGGAVP